MMLRRREFITLLSGTAAWPLAARAQQPTMPVIGFLNSLGSNDRPNLRDAFHRGLRDVGFVPGSNVAIEYRYADNQVHHLPALAADLVNRRVAVIAATGGGASVRAAKEATTAIPIVFVSAGDPVKEGYVASLNRPGGNLTGITWFGTLLSGKGFGLLHELVPNATLIALLVNPIRRNRHIRRRTCWTPCAHLAGSCLCSMQARAVRSTRRLPRCSKDAPTRSL
jgi:putative ABC transport system substrate-binding protein